MRRLARLGAWPPQTPQCRRESTERAPVVVPRAEDCESPEKERVTRRFLEEVGREAAVSQLEILRGEEEG